MASVSLVLIVATVVTVVTLTRKTELAPPSQILYDEDNNLNWSKVDNAREYSIELQNLDTGKKFDYTTKNNQYSLSNVDEGDYEIKIKSVAAAGSKYKDSEWKSMDGFFRKYHETGCVYVPIKSNTAFELSKVGSAKGAFTIEADYRGKPVTSIAAKAFKNSTLITEITIEDGIESIGESAFYSCTKLESVTLPDSVKTIGANAFRLCKILQKIKLPANLTEIKEETFNYCRGLTEIEFGNKLKTIGKGAFSNCSSLTSVVIPDSVESIGSQAFLNCYDNTDKSNVKGLKTVAVGAGVKTIGESAFYKCSELTTVNFAEGGSLSSIGDSAFAACAKLQNAELKEGLVQIGAKAFYGCSLLADAVIPSTVKTVGSNAFYNTAAWNDIVLVDPTTKLVYVDKWVVGIGNSYRTQITAINKDTFKENTVGIAASALSNLENLGSIVLPSSIKYIGADAFANCKKVNLFNSASSSLLTIGKRAFNGCQMLKTLTLNDGLLEIDDYAFYNCSNLNNGMNSIIPSTVTRVGRLAFKGTGLWNAVTSGVVYAGDWVVGYNGEFKTAEIQSGTRGIAEYAFQESLVESLTGVNNVRIIGKAAFYKCTELESLSLNNNLAAIEAYTFYGCNNLNIEIPYNIEYIGTAAFYQCYNMTSFDISSVRYRNIKSIGDYAFFDCSAINKFDLGNKVQYIGAQAFYNCNQIPSISIPDSVIYLGTNAFGKCSSATSLSIGSGINSVTERAFEKCSAITEIVIPDTITSIGEKAFYDCSAVTSLKISDSVVSIGANAFAGLSNLYTVNIPASVTYIGDYAFRGTSLALSVTISDKVETIGMHAFYGMNGATIYTEVSERKDNWDSKFNSSYRPVVWGCVLSEDKTYVTSVAVKDGFITELGQSTTISAPTRKGYTFVGWALSENGEVVYSANELQTVANGTVLYAVWTEGEPTPPPVEPETPESPEA